VADAKLNIAPQICKRYRIVLPLFISQFATFCMWAVAATYGAYVSSYTFSGDEHIMRLNFAWCILSLPGS
jgi:hypothetical protein